MNTRNSLTTALLTIAICMACLVNLASAQNPQNLVTGVGPVVSNYGWANWSAMNLIPGSSLIASSSTTRFYLGFTAGTTADISNMVVYTTDRAYPVITAVTPVTLNGISNPSITLSDACHFSFSSFAPCIVPLDTAPIALSPLNDYYLVIYFKNNANNNILGVGKQKYATSSMVGSDAVGDLTTRKVGDLIPLGNRNGAPHLLMFVMNQ